MVSTRRDCPAPSRDTGASMTDRLIGIRDAAHRLCVSARTLYRMEDRGEIERVVVTGRRFGYRESDIDDIVAGRVAKGKRTSGHRGWIKQPSFHRLPD